MTLGDEVKSDGWGCPVCKRWYPSKPANCPACGHRAVTP